MFKPSFAALVAAGLAAGALSVAGVSAEASARHAHASAAPTAFLSSLHTITTIGSTVPASGDVNPYGLEVVPTTAGSLTAGDYLVSNFNAKSNHQGTGTTIVELSPAGKQSLFATIDFQANSRVPAPAGLGLRRR